jgi:hypothetical protein
VLKFGWNQKAAETSRHSRRAIWMRKWSRLWHYEEDTRKRWTVSTFLEEKLWWHADRSVHNKKSKLNVDKMKLLLSVLKRCNFRQFHGLIWSLISSFVFYFQLSKHQATSQGQQRLEVIYYPQFLVNFSFKVEVIGNEVDVAVNRSLAFSWINSTMEHLSILVSWPPNSLLLWIWPWYDLNNTWSFLDLLFSEP